MKTTAELISTQKTESGYFAVTFLINSSYYKTFRLSGYNRTESIKRARSLASREAQKDSQLANQS